MPLLLLLLPLLWDWGGLPPPPKLPCIATDKNLGSLENTECRCNKNLENKMEVMADCNTTHPAPSFFPSGWVIADTLPLAITARAPADVTSQTTIQDNEIEMGATPLPVLS